MKLSLQELMEKLAESDKPIKDASLNVANALASLWEAEDILTLTLARRDISTRESFALSGQKSTEASIANTVASADDVIAARAVLRTARLALENAKIIRDAMVEEVKNMRILIENYGAYSATAAL